MRLLRQYIKEILGVARARKSIKEICGASNADIENAMATANLAHLGQERRSGDPYIVHPVAVADIVYHFYPDDQTLCGIALLHDTMEDALKHGNVKDAEEMASRITASFGDPGAGQEALRIVRALTHEKGKPYDEYVVGLADDPSALRIKLADMLHNLSSTPTDRQLNKYARALKVLMDVSGGKPSSIDVGHWEELLELSGLNVQLEPAL
tara:strand:+ start:389 stop:1018 length:630 start_codon:yes stop_codon:yes gene_type:complete